MGTLLPWKVPGIGWDLENFEKALQTWVAEKGGPEA